MSRNKTLSIREICLFGILAALTFAAKYVMSWLPNIEPVSLMVMLFAVTFGWKALFPIYFYVLLIGLSEGMGAWWLPYIYVWTILWGMVMLLPKKMPKWLAPIVYALVCGLHGFGFGFWWIPSQMALMGFSLEQALIWWQFGFLTADIPHGIGNLVGSTLIIPLVTLIRKLDRRIRH